MCFWNEYDWTAGLYEDETVKLDQAEKCYECRDVIHPGQECRHVWMQEYDYCPECGCGYESDGTTDEPCDDPEGHQYGEQFECYICKNCQKLLSAIQEVEQEHGCKNDESQPALGELQEAFCQSDNAIEYLERAANKYPELVANGHVDRFYRLTSEWEQDQDRWSRKDMEPVPEEELGGGG